MSIQHLVLDMYDLALRSMKIAKATKDKDVLQFARTTLSALRESVDVTRPTGSKLYALYRQWEGQLKDFDNLDRVINEVTKLRDICKENAL